MRGIERLMRLLSRKEVMLRSEHFESAPQVVLNIYRYRTVMSDWQLFMNMTSCAVLIPRGLDDVSQITASLEERGFLKLYRETPEEGRVRVLSEDGKRALKKIRKVKGAFAQPVTIELPAKSI